MASIRGGKTVNLVLQIVKVIHAVFLKFHRLGCSRMIRQDTYDAYAASGSDA